MRLQVIVDNGTEYENAASAPQHEMNMAECKGYVKEVLAKAEADGAKTACMRSIELAEKTSDNFQLIGWIEQAVKEFQVEHALPEIVRIVCNSAEAAEQYKVVYNFYYADSKATRLQDDKWD